MKFSPLRQLFLFMMTFSFIPLAHSVQIAALGMNDLKFADCPENALELLQIDGQKLNPLFDAEQLQQADLVLIHALRPRQAETASTQLLQQLGHQWQAKVSREADHRQSLLLWRKPQFQLLGSFNQPVAHHLPLWVVLGRMNGSTVALFSSITEEPYSAKLARHPLLRSREPALFSGFMTSSADLPMDYQLQQNAPISFASRGINVCDHGKMQRKAAISWFKLAIEN